MFLWLAISMFLEGIPSGEDNSNTKHSVLVLTPTIYTLNTYAYGELDTIIALAYVFLVILLANIRIEKQQKFSANE